MSRNRSTTQCDCGLWAFQTERILPLDEILLLTQEAYFDVIDLPKDHPWRSGNGSYGPWGYGYAERLHGSHFMYHPPGNKRACASHRHGVYTEARLVADYKPVPEADRYRYRRLECVFCGRTYAGWYRRDPVNDLDVQPDAPLEDRPHYELYDTSFFWAFNDEPAEKDGPKRTWSAQKLAALAKRWNEEER